MPRTFAPTRRWPRCCPSHRRAAGEAFWTPPESAFRVVSRPKPQPSGDAAVRQPENESIWQKLPPFTWRLPLKAVKPGAEVLAYARPEDEAPAVTTATTLLNAVEQMRAEKLRQEQHALVVVQPFGRGKVVALATDQSWRLRYRVGDTLHHRFWGRSSAGVSASACATAHRSCAWAPTASSMPPTSPSASWPACSTRSSPPSTTPA